MLNPISEMFRNVSKEKGMFFSSLISLMVVFTLLDVLLIFFYNLNDFKAKLDVSNQVIIYVKTMAELEDVALEADKLFEKISGVLIEIVVGERA